MPNPAATPEMSRKSIVLLSQLLLSPSPTNLAPELQAMSREQFDDLAALANSNHVIIRAFEIFLGIMHEAGDAIRSQWIASELATERARIQTALPFLHNICQAFNDSGYPVTVIKSLDHMPDLGSDLDLYTDTDSHLVAQLMADRFQATMADRSWGDRLARKWNFMMPGLPEAVEIHMGRLGQTGEQAVIASSLMRRTRTINVQGLDFRVTSITDRLLISTLQRMYRHFYFRLCDIIDSAGLVESNAVDWSDLEASARAADIWEGVATYLVIVSDYVKKYRGTGLNLPQAVLSNARFGGDLVYFAKEFIRVPILPQSAKLYGSQLTGMLKKGEINNGARLTLLPALATVALVGQKITGSDKGIW